MNKIFKYIQCRLDLKLTKNCILSICAISSLLFLMSGTVRAEIKSKPVLESIFEGCTSEYIEGQQDFFSFGAHLEYCGCLTHKISNDMKLEEVMLLGIDMMTAKDEDEEMNIMLANQKVVDLVTQCTVKVFEE